MKPPYRRRRERPVLTPLSKQAREMIVARDALETRIAFIEEGKLAEYYHERNTESSIVGNIYKGRVTAVLPGLQAAFVDIGLEKSGFLHARDVLTEAMTLEDFLQAQQARKQEDGGADEAAEGQEGRKGEGQHAGRGAGPRRMIQDLLVKGQEILVQVEKESISTKGPRLTGQIAIPARTLVLIPEARHTGVSHRITQETERARLKKIMDAITPKGFGTIARTSAEGATEDEVKSEMQYLSKLWKQIKAKEKKSRAPALLHEEQGLLHRVARDLLNREDRRILVDAPQDGRQIKQWLDDFLSSLHPEIELYKGDRSLFESLNLEAELEKALRPKVWLKCGGYLIIEETEALVVVDVNTGRHVGKTRQDETILKTNLEAAQEIGRQLRLRDLGGIIVLDFIDMRLPEHKERVFQELSKSLRRDRAKTNLRRLTDLGLIEMTRKRVRGSLLRSLYEECPMCQGRGRVPSKETMGIKLYRMLEKVKRVAEEKEFILEVSPYWHVHQGELAIRDQAKALNVKVLVRMNRDLKTEDFRLLSSRTAVVLANSRENEAAHV